MGNILEEIYKSSLKFLSPLNPQETYEAIVSEAVHLTGTKWGSIFLAHNDALKRVYTNQPSKLQPGVRKRGYTYKTFKTGRAHVLAGKSIKKTHPLYGKAKAVVFVPLYYGSGPVGVLNLLSDRIIKLDRQTLHQLQLYGSMASLAIHKAQLLEKAQEALKNRDFFISTASHELKTPLTSIYVYAQLLSQKFGESKNPEGKWSKNLYKEVNRLTRLVNEFLHVDSVKAGALKYFIRKHSLKKIVQQAISDSLLAYPEHNFVATLENKRGNYFVYGDFDKLLQAILNLLTNAAKFSPAGSLITVTLFRQGSDNVLAIQDNGKGIPKEELERVFDVFYKGKGSYQEGMGIGLYLVKEIIEKHHGEIKLISHPGKGTRVEIRLLEAK